MTERGGLTEAFARAVAQAELKGTSRKELATMLGVETSTLSRYVTGRSSVPIEALPVVDEACGRPRGYILGLAGYVDNGAVSQVDVRSAIATDPELPQDLRETLLAVYDGFRAKAETRPADTTPAAQEKPDRLSPAEKRRLLAEHNLESARPKSKTPSQADDKAG